MSFMAKIQLSKDIKYGDELKKKRKQCYTLFYIPCLELGRKIHTTGKAQMVACESQNKSIVVYQF